MAVAVVDFTEAASVAASMEAVADSAEDSAEARARMVAAIVAASAAVRIVAEAHRVPSATADRPVAVDLRRAAPDFAAEHSPA
jgi:hypothetical protein